LGTRLWRKHNHSSFEEKTMNNYMVKNGVYPLYSVEFIVAIVLALISAFVTLTAGFNVASVSAFAGIILNGFFSVWHEQQLRNISAVEMRINWASEEFDMFAEHPNFDLMVPVILNAHNL
jgi:hypothetical protein